MPMVSGIMELCMRAAAALILPVYFGQDGIFYAEILAWTGATVVLVASYYVELRIRQRKLIFGNRE